MSLIPRHKRNINRLISLILVFSMIFNFLFSLLPINKVYAAANLTIESIGETGAQYYVSGLGNYWNNNYYRQICLTRSPIPSSGISNIESYSPYNGSYIFPSTSGTSYTSSWGNLSGLTPGTSYKVYAAVKANNEIWYPGGEAYFTTKYSPVYPIVSMNNIPDTTVGKPVTVSATSSSPTYRMAAKYSINGSEIWLPEQYNTTNYQSIFTPQIEGTYTVTVYSRSYPETDPRSGQSLATKTFTSIYPDTNEPNNTDATASTITPGNNISSYISYVADGDIWKFTTGTSNIGNMSASLTVPSNADFELQVYEGTTTGTELKGSYNAGNGITESLGFLVNPSTAYYLKVYSRGNASRSASPYTLALSAMPIDTNEPNNIITDAKAIAANSSVNSYLSTGSDFDYWKYTPTATGAINVQLTVPAGLDYDLQVYEGTASALGTLVRESISPGNATESKDFTATQGKTYYFKVYQTTGAYSATAAYGLILGGIYPDTNEPNNTDATASGITPGTSVSSYISYVADGDIWRFTTGTSNIGNMSASLTVPSNADFELQVYEGTTTGSELKGSYNAGNGASESIGFSVNPSTTYYLKVYSKGNAYRSASPYTLTLSAMPVDTNEPNNTITDAKTIAANSSVNSYLSTSSDFDYWKYTPTATGAINVQLMVPAGLDYDLQVYEGTASALGTLVRESTSPGNATESKDFTATQGKTYYFKVYQTTGAYSATAAYGLILGSIAPDTNEMNNTFEEATPIVPGASIESYISYDEDCDIWKFATGESNIGEVIVKLSNIPSGVDYELQIWDETLLKGESLNTGNADEVAFIQIRPEKNYFIKIYSYNNKYHSRMPYTLSVSSLPIAPDSYEPNDTPVQAYPLTPASSINSYISKKSDGDYYTFTTDGLTVGYVNVELIDPIPDADQSDIDPDYDFQVYKDTITEANIVGYSTSKESQSLIEFKVVPNTRYYIKIYNGGNYFVTKPYQLKVSALPHDEESNENEGSAKSLPTRGVVESYLYQPKDVDYWVYRSGAAESGTKVFGMKVPGGRDYELQVYPSDKMNEMKGSYNNNNAYEYVLMDIQPNTTYYMKVYGALGKELPDQYSIDYPYTLSVGTDQYGEGTTGGNESSVDSYEPNDTRTLAVAVEDGKTVKSYIHYDGDIDYYRVRTGILSGILTVNLEVPTAQDYELQVFEGSSSRVWTSDKGHGLNESATVDVKSNTNYYIKIYGAKQGSGHSYSAALLDKYILTIGDVPKSTTDEWINDSTQLNSNSKWDKSIFTGDSDWINTGWEAVDGIQGQLSDLYSYWTNQKEYLLSLINHGVEGEKEWAQQRYELESERVFLLQLILTGSDGEKAWANNQLFIVNSALFGTYGEQQWAHDILHWQNLHSYYQRLLDDSPDNIWAQEREEVTVILQNPNAQNKEWALERWKWLSEEDYLQNLISDSPDLGTVKWAKERADLLNKILRGTVDEQVWAQKRWTLLELIEHGTQLEREKAQWELDEMDGKHVVVLSEGISTSLYDDFCTDNSCRESVDKLSAALYVQTYDNAKPFTTQQYDDCSEGIGYGTFCRDLAYADRERASNYAYSNGNTPEVVLSNVPTSGSGTDPAKLAVSFIKGLGEGVLSYLIDQIKSITETWKLLRHWKDTLNGLKELVKPFVDALRGERSISSVLESIVSLLAGDVVDLVNDIYVTIRNYGTTYDKYDVAETLGNQAGKLVGMVVQKFLTEGALNVVQRIAGEVKIVKKATAVADEINDLCHCFTAGTRVLTQGGEKPIEQVVIGDMVLAKNPDTGEMAYKEVDLLMERPEDEVWKVTVGKEVISTSDEHPFWIKDKGWVVTKNLVVGDLFETSDGSHLSIDKIEVKYEPTMVYNFRVKDFHTYYVSNLRILTHNSNGSCGWTPPTRIPFEFKDNTMDHIFKGEVKNGRASGWHYFSDYQLPGNEILDVLKNEDKYGTIEALVKVGGVDKAGISSFFSNKYTPQQVINLIMDAYQGASRVVDTNGNPTNTFRGISSNGMTIEFQKYGDGTSIADIISAYPVHELSK